jgi:hypothetical protein
LYCTESLCDSAVLNNSTPLRVTKLEVINCTDAHRSQNVSNLFDSPVESRSPGSSLAGPSSSSAGSRRPSSKPEDSGMQTDSEGLVVLKSQLEGNRSGLGGWSPATVIHVNAVRTAQGVVKSSTYDIQYDDGAVEKGVDIRLLRARSSLASTSTLSGTHCSVLEGLPSTHDTGIAIVNTPGKKGAAEEGRAVVRGNGNDGMRSVVAGGGASSVPSAAAASSAAPSAAAVTGEINVDNAAKDGPAKLAAPLNRPTLSKSPSSSSSASSSAARAVSYSHSSSRQVAKSNRAVGGDADIDAGSAAGTMDKRAGTRQAEANKIIRQSYPSLEDPQYDSDREFTRSSFKAPLTAAERGPGVSRAVVKRSLQGREQLKDFFRDSTPDPLKEGGKKLSTEIVKEPLEQVQVQVQVPVMRTADTHTHTDTDGGAAPSQGIQASEEQSSKVNTAEQAIKQQQQQQLPSSLPLSSLPSQSSIGRAEGSPVTKQVPRALDGADMLQTRDNKTGEVGKTHEQAPIVNQAGQSAPDLVREMTASETVSPVAAAGDALFDDMEVGSRVEGNYADIGEWFTGRISKKWRDGSYDIQYDDGDREVGVRPPLVRLLKTSQ